MSQAVSPSVDRVYGLARVARRWNVSRATVYRHQRAPVVAKRRPGPVGPCDDATLLEHIRKAITESRFTGEGYRKIWARLRFAGIRTSPGRVRRLMGENGLLAPHRVSKRPENTARRHHHHRGRERPVGHRHDPDRHPERGRGARLRRRRSLQQRMRRHPRRQERPPLPPWNRSARVCARSSAIGKDVAAGPHAPARPRTELHMSDDFQDEIAFFGLEASPSFVGCVRVC